MKPLTHCPACKVPMRWLAHDGVNTYLCGNKSCPIDFSEKVWFPDKGDDFQLDNECATLFHYECKVGKYKIAFYSEGSRYLEDTPKLIINYFYSLGDLAGGKLILELDKYHELDFSDLSLLENKIKTWITFS